MRRTLKNLRVAILREQGKLENQVQADPDGSLRPKRDRTTELKGKTDRMLLVEQENGGVDITILLAQGTVREVGDKLKVNFGTVSLWRRQLGIATGALNGHQMHKESCGPDCHAVSLGRCYAPSCKHPTCPCWHYDGDDPILCKACFNRRDHIGCLTPSCLS